jgi:hypothetical protein
MPDKLLIEQTQGQNDAHGNRAGMRRRDLLLAAGVSLLLTSNAFARPAELRRLTLKNTHTGETFTGPYRDATGPLPSAVSDLAVFLRDFHADKTGPVIWPCWMSRPRASRPPGQSDAAFAVSDAANGVTNVSATTQRVSCYAPEVGYRDRRSPNQGSPDGGMSPCGGAASAGIRARISSISTADRRGAGCWMAAVSIALVGGSLNGPPGGILTVRQRMARLQALARREKLLRK